MGPRAAVIGPIRFQTGCRTRQPNLLVFMIIVLLVSFSLLWHVCFCCFKFSFFSTMLTWEEPDWNDEWPTVGCKNHNQWDLWGIVSFSALMLLVGWQGSGSVVVSVLGGFPFPQIKRQWSNGDCLERKRENYRVCSVPYCVQQLCTVQCTHIWTDLTVVCWLDLAFLWLYCMLQFVCVRFSFLALFCVIVCVCDF